jgi:hypothetical protein
MYFSPFGFERLEALEGVPTSVLRGYDQAHQGETSASCVYLLKCDIDDTERSRTTSKKLARVPHKKRQNVSFGEYLYDAEWANIVVDK